MHTTDSVFQAFERASKLAMRLPSGAPQGVSSSWPEILRLAHEGYFENNRSSEALTSKEVEEFETTSAWIKFIDDEGTRRMLWLYASGMPGWQIAKLTQPRVSQPTVSRRILAALALITGKLNLGMSPPEIEYRGERM